MQAEAAAAQSSGVVGVTVDVKNHVWGEHATEFLATGTAVRRLAADLRADVHTRLRQLRALAPTITAWQSGRADAA
jgi:hypothetical protein